MRKYTVYALIAFAVISMLGSFTYGLSGQGEATQVAFFTDNYTISSDTRLYWNNFTGRLGVGTSDPQGTVDIFSTNDSRPALIIRPESLIENPTINGSIEFDGDTFFGTKQGSRHSFMMAEGIRRNQSVVTNTTDTVVISNYTLLPSELEQGKMFHTRLYGSFDTASSSDMFNLTFWIGDDLIGTSTPNLKNVQEAPFRATFTLTVYGEGPNATYAAYTNVDLDRTNQDIPPTLGTIDTTAPNDLHVELTWNDAKPGNVFRLQQEVLEIVN